MLKCKQIRWQTGEIKVKLSWYHLNDSDRKFEGRENECVSSKIEGCIQESDSEIGGGGHCEVRLCMEVGYNTEMNWTFISALLLIIFSKK